MAAETGQLQLVTPTQGTLSGTWGDTVNNGITEYCWQRLRFKYWLNYSAIRSYSYHRHTNGCQGYYRPQLQQTVHGRSRRRYKCGDI